MQRLYQWLSEWASFFRYHEVGAGTNSTIRTETTVRREGITLLVGNAATVAFDACPLCGSKLASEQSEQARLRLQEGPISQGSVPVDVPPK